MNLKMFRDDKSINWPGKDDASSYQYAVIQFPRTNFLAGWVLCVLQQFSMICLSRYFTATKIRHIELRPLCYSAI